MTTVTYESLKAEQAWIIVSEQLQQRNSLLSRGISRLEQYPAELPIASRLMILRYHLRHSIRRLTSEAKPLSGKTPAETRSAEQLRQQWRHVHQLFFLLRQIDAELRTAQAESDTLRTWLNSANPGVYKSALMYLN
ncbi:MAG: hypothetical protein H7Z72_00395 [Bacteroidetes bacterium]|nr:hypothetical protein [Fibrella sp.]